MKVGIRQGVCYDSPAEWTSPENGWRWSVPPILDRCGGLLAATSKRAWGLWRSVGRESAWNSL